MLYCSVPRTDFHGTTGFRKRVSGVLKSENAYWRKSFIGVAKLYVRIKIRVATFDTNHSVSYSKQTINHCFKPEASLFYSQVIQHSSPWTIVVSGESIRLSIILRLVVDFLHAMYIKDKQVLVFNFIFDWLWTGTGSSVCSVAFLGFLELK